MDEERVIEERMKGDGRKWIERMMSERKKEKKKKEGRRKKK